MRAQREEGRVAGTRLGAKIDTKDLDRLAGWDERDLALMVTQFVRELRRLPSVEQLLAACPTGRLDTTARDRPSAI